MSTGQVKCSAFSIMLKPFLPWPHAMILKVGSVTLDVKFGGAFRFAEGVDRLDFILSVVLGGDPEDVQGADSVGVGDVVVAVGLQAGVVEVPCDVGLGKAAHGAGHVALVAFGVGVHLQRDEDRRGPLHGEGYRCACRCLGRWIK